MARTRITKPKVVIDPIRTHDLIPAVAIYTVADSEPIKCPLFSYQVYDVSPHQPSSTRAMTVAVQLHEGTIGQRGRNPEIPQRIDVYSFPMPFDCTEDDKAVLCISHQRAEIDARMKSGTTDFFMQPTFLEEEFEGKGFLSVGYDQKVPNEEREEDDHPPVISVGRTKDMSGWYLNPKHAKKRLEGRPLVMEALGSVMRSREDIVQWFYLSYVREGTIYEDIRKANQN
ncbi:hypothetical protein B0O99DRAFT_745947 [Bisporella sp. PMI_857]|nr:hypothetical protein B0O99DRAFT_745947 [Bisporella sp. PMI_857]